MKVKEQSPSQDKTRDTIETSPIKQRIRKHSHSQYKKFIMKKKRCLPKEYLICEKPEKQSLTIEIPDEPEIGQKVKAYSDFADVNEEGIFYGIALKKGPFRRTNEDRVFLIILIFVVLYTSIF